MAETTKINIELSNTEKELLIMSMEEYREHSVLDAVLNPSAKKEFDNLLEKLYSV